MFYKKVLLGVIAFALLVCVGGQVVADPTRPHTSDKDSLRRAKIADRQMEQWRERMAALKAKMRKEIDAGTTGADLRRAKIAVDSNAKAVLSLDLIANGGAGNQTDDGVHSGIVSGQGTKIAVEVFAKGVTTSLVGAKIEFDFDASVLTFDKAENSAFALVILEAAGASLASPASVTLPASGFIARAEFTTAVDVTGREFSIGIKQVTLAESAASSDTITTPNAIAFNAALSHDFDGDGTVGFSDFLVFAGQYGAQTGDGRYQARYDLDANGVINFSDFLMFASSYGQQVSPSGGGTVTIADANLRAVIADSLGKASGASITTTEMATLTRLDASNKGIRSLTGLEHATNLQRLNLWYNSISDVSALSSLTNLTWLRLSSNSLSDISVLSNLTNLTELHLGGTSLSDISALSNLTNLTTLWLDNNSLSDISALANLTNLTDLFLYNNSISDLAPLVANTGLDSGDVVDVRNNPLSATSINTHIPTLQGRGVEVVFDTPPVTIPDAALRAVIANALGKASGASITTTEMATLTRLDASNKGIRSLTGLEHATNLQWLDLGVDFVNNVLVNSNDISNLSPLSNLTNLTELRLGGNSITDVSALSNLTNLTDLSLSSNSITDVSALSSLTNLTRLVLGGNSISDISALSNLTNLTELILAGNSISNISTLSNLTNLTLLNLNNNGITDVSALSSLTNLALLYLAGNSISDISALSNLTNLILLSLSSNSTSDISALSNLTNLILLSLSSNSTSDISALSNLTNLTRLWLYNNSISDISALSNLTNLTELILFNNSISDLAPLVSNTGLGSGDQVDVRGNPLSTASINTHIPALQDRGVTVYFGSSKPAAMEELRRMPREVMNRTVDYAPHTREEGKAHQ